MGAVKKITVHLPEELVKRAQENTGEGTTATIRRGLELLAARQIYKGLRELRGKAQLNVDLSKLREDR